MVLILEAIELVLYFDDKAKTIGSSYALTLFTLANL